MAQLPAQTSDERLQRRAEQLADRQHEPLRGPAGEQHTALQVVDVAVASGLGRRWRGHNIVGVVRRQRHAEAGVREPDEQLEESADGECGGSDEQRGAEAEAIAHVGVDRHDGQSEEKERGVEHLVERRVDAEVGDAVVGHGEQRLPVDDARGVHEAEHEQHVPEGTGHAHTIVAFRRLRPRSERVATRERQRVLVLRGRRASPTLESAQQRRALVHVHVRSTHASTREEHYKHRYE